MNFKSFANLEETKMMARGNTQKIAKYVQEEKAYRGILKEHFNEEFPFANSFDEHHLSDLKKFAEENPDDESAQVRYNLQKERFAVQESNKTKHIDLRVGIQQLRQKLQAGEKMDKKDLLSAEKLTRQSSTPDNLALYSQIKRSISEGDVE